VLKIESSDVQDCRADASHTVRPQAPIGEKYVDCLPTQPRVDGTRRCHRRSRRSRAARKADCRRAKLLHGKLQIPPFLLPIFQAAGTAYGVR
jgi:hypothetical protein